MRTGRHLGLLLAVTALLAIPVRAVSDLTEQGLADVGSFASISDPAERSVALFNEAAKVLTHPRCTNCHPAGDRPRQGDLRRPHQPPVVRGEDGFGRPALRCPVCHQQANVDAGRVPGDPDWHLARPKWPGKARRSGKYARRSKIPRAMAAARLIRLCTMSAPIIWWVGLGRRGWAVSPLRVRKHKRVSCSTNG